MTLHCAVFLSFFSLAFPAHLDVFQLLKNVVVQHLDIRAFHSRRAGLNNSSALELPERIDNDRPCDSYAVRDLARDQDPFLAVQLVKDMNDRLEFRDGLEER